MTDWRAYITHRCMFCAGSLEIVKLGVDELGKLPGNVIRVAQAKVHELAGDADRMQAAHKPEREIQQHIESELWQLLRPYGPTRIQAAIGSHLLVSKSTQR